MEFRILGHVQVLDDGRELPLGGARQRALLAALLIRPNEVVSADRLIDELWPGERPANPENALQAQVSRLRRALGDGRVEHRAGGYVLHAEPGERDVDRFLDLRARGDLRDALALWRGRPLADVEFADFAQAEIARLEELRLATTEERIDADLARGRQRELVPELERLVVEHPLREGLRGRLMLALYRCGRQADALDVYRDARRTLVEELGLEPGEELRELERAILRHDRKLRPLPRPTRLALGAVAAAAVALAVALPLTLVGGSAGVQVGPQEVGVLDASTGRVLAAVPLGFEPTTAVAGAGGVWVGGRRGQLVQIDPDRARVAATYAVGDFSIEGLAAGDHDVFFAQIGDRETTIYRLVTSPELVAPVVRIPDRSQLDRQAPEPLALAGDTLWASNGITRLTRVDLPTRRATTFLPDNGSGEIWAAPDVVWSLNAQTDTLTRIDPRSGASLTVVPLAQNDAAVLPAFLFPIKLVAEGSSVWIAEYRGRSVGRVDATTNAVAAQIRVHGSPVSVVAAPRAVWVAIGGGTLQRIDPASNRIVQTVHLGGTPRALALAHGRLFVALARAADEPTARR